MQTRPIKFANLIALTGTLLAFFAHGNPTEKVVDYNCFPQVKTLSALFEVGYDQVQIRRKSILNYLELGLEQAQKDVLSNADSKQVFAEIQNKFETEAKLKSEESLEKDGPLVISPTSEQIVKLNQLKSELESKFKNLFTSQLSYGSEPQCKSEYVPSVVESKMRIYSAYLKVSCTYSASQETIPNRRFDVTIEFPQFNVYRKTDLQLQIVITEYGDFGNDGEQKLYYVIQRTDKMPLLSDETHKMDEDEYIRKDFQIATIKAITSAEFSENTERQTGKLFDKKELINTYVNKSCVIPGDAKIGEWEPYSPFIYNTDNDADVSMSFSLREVFPPEMLDQNGLLKKNFQVNQYGHAQNTVANLYLRNGKVGAALSVAKDLTELTHLRAKQIEQIEKFKAEDNSFCWVQISIPVDANTINFVNPLAINREHVSWRTPIKSMQDQDLLTTYTEISNPDLRYYHAEGIFSSMTKLVCQERVSKNSLKTNFEINEVFSHLSPGKLQMRLFQQKDSWERRKKVQATIGVQP